MKNDDEMRLVEDGFEEQSLSDEEEKQVLHITEGKQQSMMGK